ncbi:hypothetical protein HFV04_021265 [Pseudomonas sp. BIGb0427]|uniref:hypothetical protein n=1 Tax=unclassified Pseudomonas TaxID=196821 RepID=UPI0018A7DD9C|nr:MULTISPECIES: hypothetical protein [unclassified Pseudomonas]QPG62035.1 hypothetical protein HFV04_021265 [Pseudomonas sp. BIGb0427]UVM64392.1 hypothetical protein LOY34_13610 [Pseudomonas sp. B21-009]
MRNSPYQKSAYLQGMHAAPVAQCGVAAPNININLPEQCQCWRAFRGQDKGFDAYQVKAIRANRSGEINPKFKARQGGAKNRNRGKG